MARSWKQALLAPVLALMCLAAAAQDLRGAISATREVEVLDVEAAYRRYGPMVRRRCQRLLGEPEAARDATQDVFVRLVRQAVWRVELLADFPDVAEDGGVALEQVEGGLQAEGEGLGHFECP